MTARYTEPHPQSRAAQILRLNGEGWPNVAIAAQMKCTPQNISIVLKYYARKCAPKRRIETATET